MTSRTPIRSIISNAMLSVDEGFVPCPDSTPGYWFVRGPLEMFRDYVIIQFSKKASCFTVDVAVTAYPTWDKCYGHHQLHAATGLPNLRVGSSAISAEEAIYCHDGSRPGVESAIARIASDLQSFALPWFDDFRKKANEDEVLQFGLRWIRLNRTLIPKDISSQIEQALVACRYRRDRVRHSLLGQLKDDLRAHAAKIGASKWHRKETMVLGLDLLFLANQLVNLPDSLTV